MPKKIPGELAPPPTQAKFDKIPLGELCIVQPRGIFRRLHSLNGKTGKPWSPIYFSNRGTSRFDHKQGPGTLYVGTSLAGVLMEIFDDAWGHLGDPRRSLSERMFSQWFLSGIHVPGLRLFDATGSALSKIGTDLQLLTGPYDVTQEWGLRIASQMIWLVRLRRAGHGLNQHFRAEERCGFDLPQRGRRVRFQP